MSFFIFLYFVILGVEVGNTEIVHFHHKDISSIELRSSKKLTSSLKQMQNLEYDHIENNLDSKFTHFQSTIIIV